MAWQHNGTGSNDKGHRDDATTKQTNKQMDKQTNKVGATWGNDTARGEEDVMQGDGSGVWFFVFCWGGGYWLCRSTFDVGISSKLTRLLSVRGMSMSANYDTKVCRHTRNDVVEIGLSGQKLATLLLVANMSLTCHQHYYCQVPLWNEIMNSTTSNNSKYYASIQSHLIYGGFKNDPSIHPICKSGILPALNLTHLTVCSLCRQQESQSSGVHG